MTRLSEEVRATVSPHKFGDSRRAAAAWILSGEGMADEETGDVDAGGYFARIGRTVVSCDSQGFVDATRYPSEAEARDVFHTLATPSVWALLEDPPAGCEAVASLYNWSTNYEAGRGPISLFLDLIGWSDEQLGEPIYSLKDASLGYVELDKLGLALREYSDRPSDVRAYVDQLLEAEARG